MAGRREQQKQQRRAAILRAASRLFASRGYAETGMQDIARRARLAVGTLYNYFPSKPEIVLALVERDVVDALTAGEAVIKRPPRDPVAAVTALLELDFAPLARHDRALWRELVGAAMADPEVGTSFFASDLRLVGQLAVLLRELQARGALRRDLDAGRAAIAVYGVFFTWFMAFVSSEAISLDVARAEIRRGVGLLMNGLLERAPARR
jgi:AcrR family transcriptional regulator